jgi:hypothetical protein
MWALNSELPHHLDRFFSTTKYGGMKLPSAKTTSRHATENLALLQRKSVRLALPFVANTFLGYYDRDLPPLRV